MAGASGSWGDSGVFWRGADGQVYVKGAEGTNSAGAWDANTQQYWADRDFALINDPNAPVQTQTQQTQTLAPSTAPVAAATGPVAPVFNQAAADNTQRTINELPGLLAAALEAEGVRYGNTMGEYNAQEQSQRGTYNKSTETNQLNYDANFMDSIRAGSKGLNGLMNILRGTGAAGGTVDDQVRDVVGGITSMDIRGGADTQKENQGQLDNSLSTFITELERKKRMAGDTRVNNERAVQRDTDTQLQDLYGKMAGFYGEAERIPEANSWMAKAGELTPSIAANSRTQISNYDTAPIQVQAPQVTAFAPPSQPDVATAPTNGQVGSGIFTMDRRRREQLPIGV